jgi:hypothetical protein
MELKPQFRDFLASIRPTDAQKENWRSSSSTLRNRLQQDDDLKGIVVSTFLQGSVRRSTAVRPLGDKRPDVDIVVVTNLDSHIESARDAMDRFEPFLEKWYPGKWRPQGRSFGIEMSLVDMDLVITALPSGQNSRDFMTRLYRSQAVETLDTLEEARNWRLNEDWRPSAPSIFGSSTPEVQLTDAPRDKWQPNPLWLPDRDVNGWGRTHPLAQIQWTAAKNRANDGNYVDLVRAIKWWRQTNSDSLPKYPKGYPLEHMIGQVLHDGTNSIAQGLVQVFEMMRDTWAFYAASGTKPRLADHGVPEHDVLKRLDTADFRAFHTAASDAADTAREALGSDDAQESATLWRQLLGTRFPTPGPQGGDRARSGFTTPAQVAVPSTTSRFA